VDGRANRGTRCRRVVVRIESLRGSRTEASSLGRVWGDQLPIANYCQRHRVRWMDDDDDDDDLASRPASNHSVFESAAECWCSVDSRASVTSPPHTLTHAGQEAGGRPGNLDEGEEWIPTAWDPIRYGTGVREKGRLSTTVLSRSPSTTVAEAASTSRSPSS
jgi:hypothetical protein